MEIKKPELEESNTVKESQFNAENILSEKNKANTALSKNKLVFFLSVLGFLLSLVGVIFISLFSSQAKNIDLEQIVTNTKNLESFSFQSMINSDNKFTISSKGKVQMVKNANNQELLNLDLNLNYAENKPDGLKISGDLIYKDKEFFVRFENFTGDLKLYVENLLPVKESQYGTWHKIIFPSLFDGIPFSQQYEQRVKELEAQIKQSEKEIYAFLQEKAVYQGKTKIPKSNQKAPSFLIRLDNNDVTQLKEMAQSGYSSFGTIAEGYYEITIWVEDEFYRAITVTYAPLDKNISSNVNIEIVLSDINQPVNEINPPDDFVLFDVYEQASIFMEQEIYKEYSDNPEEFSSQVKTTLLGLDKLADELLIKEGVYNPYILKGTFDEVLIKNNLPMIGETGAIINIFDDEYVFLYPLNFDNTLFFCIDSKGSVKEANFTGQGDDFEIKNKSECAQF